MLFINLFSNILNTKPTSYINVTQGLHPLMYYSTEPSISQTQTTIFLNFICSLILSQYGFNNHKLSAFLIFEFPQLIQGASQYRTFLNFLCMILCYIRFNHAIAYFHCTIIFWTILLKYYLFSHWYKPGM